jgi:selenocysteine lyase/cysteine desulfurase
VLYVRGELLDRITPLKVRPSSDEAPWKFAPGTPSFEAQAGTLGAIEHIAWLGSAFGAAAAGSSRREQIAAGWRVSAAHERALAKRFLEGLDTIPGARLYGLHSDNELGERVPTFSFTVPNRGAREVVQHLADRNIFAWAGSFYAHEAARRLDINPHGVVRVGLAHYTSLEEVDRVLEEVAAAAAQ